MHTLQLSFAAYRGLNCHPLYMGNKSMTAKNKGKIVRLYDKHKSKRKAS